MTTKQNDTTVLKDEQLEAVVGGLTMAGTGSGTVTFIEKPNKGLAMHQGAMNSLQVGAGSYPRFRFGRPFPGERRYGC